MNWRGFELHPETPEGGADLAELFGEDRIGPMREYTRQFAERFGIHDMRHPDRISNTRRALAVAELARDRDRLHPFRHAAMDAYWRHGQDLEDEAVIRRIAGDVGLDPDEAAAAMRDPDLLTRVDDMRRESTEAGVTGIPTFFIGDEKVVGCQPYEVLARAAEEAGAPGRGEAPND